MHSELTAIIAQQRLAEMTRAAERHHRLGAVPEVRRPGLRTRLGWTLVRWGQSLAPPPSVSSREGRPATMGA